MNKSTLQIILGVMAALMLLCLAPMPYGFYTLVRFVAMIVFAILAVVYYKKNQTSITITFGALAVLFQPLIKIALGRVMWNIVDVIVAVLLIFLLLKERKA